MQITDLKKRLNIELLPVYFLKGSDLFLRELAIKVFKGIVDEEFIDFNLDIFESIDDIKSIVSACNTVPVFSDKKIIIVKSTAKLSDGDIAFLESYLKNPSDFAILVIVDNSEKNSLNKFYKYGDVVDCNSGNVSQVNKWINDYCKKYDKQIESSAVSLLVEYSAHNMTRAVNELQKLFAYCNDRIITRGDVECLVTPDVEFVGYNLTNAITKGQNNEALKILNNLLEKGEKPSLLLAVLLNQYRRMLQARISNLEPAELAKSMGVKPYAMTMAKNLSQKYSQIELKKIVDKLHTLEYSFKSGITNEKEALLQAFAIVLIK